MKKSFWGLYILVVAVVLFLLVVRHAKADCVFVWKPGDTSAIVAGHDVHFIVEAEDVEAYRHQKKIDESFLNLPPVNSDFDDALDKLAHVHHCGDYKEVTDVDVD
jgi:hypothetical protein